MNRCVRAFIGLGFWIFASLFVFSCSSSGKIAKVADDPGYTCMNIIHTDQDLQSFSGKAYEIEMLKIADHYLNIILTYSGGCVEPDYKVYFGEVDESTYPKRAELKLVVGQKDACRELVTDTVHVDLSCFSAMARDGGISLQLSDHENEVFYALPLR